MAYYDHAAANERQRAREAYEVLKKTIGKSSSKHNKALDHMISMESEIKRQQETISEYHNFFKTLKSLLPRN